MSAVRRALLLAAAIAAAGTLARAQTVAGRVVADDGGAPLADARVEIVGATDRPAVRTDKDGRFALPAPLDRAAALRVSKAGYASRVVARAGLADVHLARGAVITGHVRDDYGTPLPFHRVIAQRRVGTNGHSTFEGKATADTDDTGEFRLYGLPAGNYVVAISGAGTRMGPGGVLRPDGPERFPSRFYPDAERPELAQIITLAAGAEASGIDFSAAVPTAPIGAPPPPLRSGGAGIRGHVARTDGSPARRARIEVASVDRSFSPVTAVSDEDGNYQLAVPPGAYLVSATDVSFTTGRFTRNNRPEPVIVAPGTVTDAVDIVVPRPSAISGRIVDEYGDSIDDVRVTLEQIRFDRGRRRIGPVFGVSPANTDDRGRFRIFGVPPGRYLIQASLAESTDPGAYFPGTISLADASPVEIAPGQDAAGIEFVLQHALGARISGRVLTAAGEPFTGAVHLLASRRSGAVAASAPSKAVAADGAFSFDGLAPGEYAIQAATSRRGVSAEGEFGAAFVSVASGDAANVVVRMTAGSTVRGRLTFDGADAPNASEIEVSSLVADADFASLADNPAARAEIHDDWTFEMSGLSGPRRIVIARAPEGWMLESIHAAGVEVTDEALPFGSSAQSVANLEIVLTTHVTELAGVIAASDKPSPRAFPVVAFSVDRALWYQTSRFIAFARSAPDGLFTMSKLPPGDYFVAAFDERDLPDPATAADNVELLRTLQPRAVRITIAPGQRATVTIGPPR